MADNEPRAGELTTTNYGWIKPTVGDSDDAWGGYINSDLDGIDSTVKSVSNAIPAASSSSPLMDGTAAVGVGTTWARADHIHPTDTSRYAASNPSGFQTAAQVTASLASYLPLAGGTLTGALTPAAAGIVGVTDATNAPAGAVGELLVTLVTTGVSLTTGPAATVGTISLTPGDWDISGEVWLNCSAGATVLGAAINGSSAFPAGPTANTSRSQFAAAFTASTHILAISPCRTTVSAATTYYLVAAATFSSGTVTATGKILARRRR